MATTVTTSTSWFSRIGSSIKGVFFGFFLVIGAIVLLFWNEGRAVKTAQSLQEGASVVVSASAESKDEANEGKLIHITGMARTPSTLTDTEFGVGGAALKLRRIVEVYQWKENTQSKTVEKLGGSQETTTTYSYEKEWSEELIDSSDFKESATHQNPTTKRFEDMEWIAENVSVGAYEIPESMVSSLSGYEPLTITQDMLTTLPYALQEQIDLVGNMIYHQTGDATLPVIGNTRIRYEIIVPQELSLIAKQSGNSLTPYTTKNNREISMIQLGTHTAEDMFEGAVAANTTMTWVLRLVGTIMMYIGIRMVFGVLPIVASVIPFFGKILAAGMSLVSGVLTLIGASITIAIAWIAYRPLIGITLLVIAIAGIVFLVRASKKTAVKK